MKKLFSLLLTAIILGTGTIALANQTNSNVKTTTQSQNPSKAQMKKEFEQRLNLTEKQKEKAKLIHQQGREQLKPIMMQIDVKRQEIETVKLTRISEKMQQERISQLNSEIKELEKQAQEIRKKNSQDFEKILNKKQKAELEKMKAEGRMRFEQNHPPRAPFQGLGTPNFLLRPLLPQMNDNGLRFNSKY
jgi:Spy/CpxP family protein refolding chaperone